jgi:hypothetical protein
VTSISAAMSKLTSTALDQLRRCRLGLGLEVTAVDLDLLVQI